MSKKITTLRRYIPSTCTKALAYFLDFEVIILMVKKWISTRGTDVRYLIGGLNHAKVKMITNELNLHLRLNQRLYIERKAVRYLDYHAPSAEPS